MSATSKPAELQAISQKSCGVLSTMGPQSSGSRATLPATRSLIYIAPDEQTVREQRKLGGFPANVISEVKAIIDPTTAE